jgi:hypothetical protein
VSNNHEVVLAYLAALEPRHYRALNRIAKDLSEDLDEASVREILSHERLTGRVTSCSHGFRLTRTYRDERAKSLNVPFRSVNVFTAPISKKNIPSVLGMREGSNDYRAWPSRYV